MDVAALRNEIAAAASALEGRVRRTPLERHSVSVDGRETVCLLKMENRQVTGSFKYRGALNRLLSLGERERAAGVVAASTGNHGAAVTRAARELGIPAKIVVPKGTSATKLAAIRRDGGEVAVCGDDCVESEMWARKEAEDSGRVFVSPYNDLLVAAGQGTIGVELLEQMGNIDAVFLSLGGGGLAGGVAAALKHGTSDPEIVACSPEHSPVMAMSLEAGHILEMPVEPTLSDGTAGGLEPGSITFDWCRELINRHVLVSEEEIAGEIGRFIDEHHQLAEGAAAVALAGFRKCAGEYVGKNVVVIVCGGNIGTETLRSVLRV